MVYGINLERMNCDKLFNLFCLYGNVVKVLHIDLFILWSIAFYIIKSLFNILVKLAINNRLNIFTGLRNFLSLIMKFFPVQEVCI